MAIGLEALVGVLALVALSLFCVLTLVLTRKRQSCTAESESLQNIHELTPLTDRERVAEEL